MVEGKAVPVLSSTLILFVSLLKFEQKMLVSEHNEPAIEEIFETFVTTTGVVLKVQSLMGILTTM